MGFSGFTYLLIVTGFGWTVAQLQPPSWPPIEYTYYPVLTNRTLRNTVIDITDFGCGQQAFCNSSLARYSNSYCFSCEKCHCDDLCSFYGDCCVDVLFDETTDFPTSPSPHITCLKQYPKYTGYKNNLLFMVTSCPDNSPVGPVTRTRCEQPSTSTVAESTPVSVNASQITYRNVYCARCHGQTDYTEWTHEVRCSQTEFLSGTKDKDELWSAVMSNPTCSVKSFFPPGVGPRECYNGLVDQCGTTGIWQTPDDRVEQLCKMYSRPVKRSATNYKNIFCSVCNGNRLSRDEECRDGHIVFPREQTFPLSVLIDFNPKPRLRMSPPTVEKAEPRCNDSQLYDPISDRCRPAQCPYGRIWSGSECELILDSVAGVGYSGSVMLTFSETLSQDQWHAIFNEYVGILRQSFLPFDPFMFTELTQILYTDSDFTGDTLTTTDKPVVGAVIRYNIVSASTDALVLDFEDTLRSLHLQEYSNFTVQNKLGILMVNPFSCPSMFRTLSLKEGLGSAMIPDRPLEVCATEFDICDFSAVHYEPVLNILNCPHLVFNLSEHNLTLNSDNSSISFNNQTINLEGSDYWVCGDVIKLCASVLSDIAEIIQKSAPTEEKIPAISVSPTLTIVSIVCIALSLVCLLLTFIVYCLLPQLRTLPGKNTMVLVAYLFCAQLVFQVGIRLTYNMALCRAMGVLIHYLWITSFISMGTCAFHMYTVFTTMSARPFQNTHKDTKKMIQYMIMSNVIGIIVVVVCIGYHAGLSDGSEIGYGGNICFLNNPIDIGIFFAGPLGVVLVFNTFCFVRVTLSIRNVPDMKSAKNQANRNHMTIYFRLSVLLGFTWIFGFIAAALQLEFLWYIFVILNGLQGVFIFVGYCVNRRIWTMLKGRCHGRRSNKYSSDSGQMNSPMASTATSSI